MKSVLISIRPKWCELIASGKTTIEVRKTSPKLESPFKCYIYCCKPQKRLRYVFTKADYEGYPGCDKMPDDYKVFCKVPDGSTPFCSPPYSGQIIGEFVCDRIDHYLRIGIEPHYHYRTATFGDVDYGAIGLTERELLGYGGRWGWHISDLKIYDKPMSLGEFHFPPEKYCERQLCGGCPKDQVMGLDGDYAFDCEWERPLTRPPQSWCYVEEVTQDD